MEHFGTTVVLGPLIWWRHSIQLSEPVWSVYEGFVWKKLEGWWYGQFVTGFGMKGKDSLNNMLKLFCRRLHTYYGALKKHHRLIWGGVG